MSIVSWVRYIRSLTLLLIDKAKSSLDEGAQQRRKERRVQKAVKYMTSDSKKGSDAMSKVASLLTAERTPKKARR